MNQAGDFFSRLMDNFSKNSSEPLKSMAKKDRIHINAKNSQTNQIFSYQYRLFSTPNLSL